MDHRPHLSEEALILHFYGEGTDQASVDRHLAACRTCQDEYARLAHVLAMVDTTAVFEPATPPGPAFEREVWARLEPQLAASRHSWLTRVLHGTPKWALAGGVAALLLVTFLAGRFSNDATGARTTEAADGRIAERVLVVAVVDHLDRSQMVLLEVMNADVESAADLVAERSLARELVSASRLYRQSAVQSGDDGTEDVLDELERVLLEIANTPQDATKDDLDALRARIAARGLIFKVRVVHSELLERGRQTIPGSQS